MDFLADYTNESYECQRDLNSFHLTTDLQLGPLMPPLQQQQQLLLLLVL